MRNLEQQVEDNGVIVQQLAENSGDGVEIGDDGEPITPFDDESSGEKRRRGRPSKADSGESAPEKRKFRYFPVPIRKTVGLTKEWGQGEFLKYWRKVAADPELRDRAVCYVYRTFPVTEVNPPGDNLDEADSKKVKYIDCTSQPFESDEDVWNRYGAGDYKFYLNDSGFPGRAKTQITGYFQGTREWEKYPPQIDPKTLVLDDPKNGSYRRYLEMKGLLPKPDEENEDDMANQAIIEKLTDRVIEMSSRPPDPPPVPVAVPVRHEDDSRAVRALAETFAQTNRVQLEMIQAAVNQATAVQARAADPFDTLAKVMTTVRELVPKPDNTALEEALRRSERLEAQLGDIGKVIQEQRIKDLESRLAQPQQPGAAPRDALTAAREFAELQREYKQIFAGDSADDDEPRRGRDPREPWYAKLAPSALGLSAFLLAGVANIFHNRAVAATGQGQPAPPPQPPADMIPPGVQQVAGALAGPQINTGDPTPMALSPQEQQVATFISMIQLPLDRHLESGATGHEFAAWMVDSYGDSVYQQIKTAGADGIQSALQRFAPGLFQKMQAMPDRSAQFLSQFIEGPDMDEENS